MDSKRFYLDPGVSRCKRMRRTVLAAAKTLAEDVLQASHAQGMDLGRSAFRWLFVTLTYRRVGEWEPRHISDFLGCVRKWFGRRGHVVPYVWVGELQKRGALHYHLLLAVPRGERMPSPDLQGWWTHGSSNVQTARNPVGYLAKYASKFGADDIAKLHKGARIHGWGGLTVAAKDRLRWKLMSKWRVAMLRERVLDREIAAREAEDHHYMGFAVHAGVCSDAEASAWWAAERRRQASEPDPWEMAEVEMDYLDRLHDVTVKGRSAFRRVGGGFVDVVEGEFFPTPFVVGSELAEDGSRRWWCEDRSALRYAVGSDVFIAGERSGERWKLAAGFVPHSRERML